MNKPVSELLHEALSLSENDRATLAKQIIESLDGPPDEGADEAWGKEIDERVEAVVAGRAASQPWDAVHGRLTSKSRNGR